jgi:uncharacterized membrane protein
MLAAYLVLKWLHVLLAIAAVGSNMTYAVWLARSAKGDPKYLAQVLRTIKFIDDRMANPAYILLLVSGIGMVTLPGNFGPSITTPWLLVSLVLYLVAVLLGFLMYTPTLRRQIAAAEGPGVDSEAYRITAAQGRQLGIILAVIVVAIVFLMVVKPNFGLAA